MQIFPKKFPNFLNLKKQGLNPEPCANQNGEIPGGAVRTGIRAALDSARWKGCPVGPWVSSALLPRGSRSLSLSLPRDKASFVCICSSSSNRAARSDNRRFAVSKISSDRGTAFFSTSRFVIWCFVEEVSTNSMLKLSSLDARHFFFVPPLPRLLLFLQFDAWSFDRTDIRAPKLWRKSEGSRRERYRNRSVLRAVNFLTQKHTSRERQKRHGRDRGRRELPVGISS